MARSSRHRPRRPDRRSSRDWRERSDSDESEEEQEASSRGRRQRDEGAARSARDSESERRKSTPGRLESDKEGPSGLASEESSGERGKKRKERLGDAFDTSSAAANRWKGNSDAAATVLEEKDVKAKEISESKSKPKLQASESKSKSSKRSDGSHADRREDGGSKDESSRKRSEKEVSRRGSSCQQADPKESERSRDSSGNREHRGAMGKDSNREASRDRGKEHVKDKERSSGRERNSGLEIERDNMPEKGRVVEKEERSRRDKEHRSNSEAKQNCGRGKHFDDNKHEEVTDTSKNSKTGCKEAEAGDDKSTKLVDGDCTRPQDMGNTDRNAQNKSYGSDLDKEQNKDGKQDGPIDKEKGQENDMDHVGKNLTRATAPSINGIPHDMENDDKRRRNKSREEAGREKRLSDAKRPVRYSRDHGNDRSESKSHKDVDQPKEKSRLQDNELDDRSCLKEYRDNYIDGRGKKQFTVENEMKTKNENNHRSSDYYNESRADTIYSSRVDSVRISRRSSPSSAIDILHDEYRHNPRRAETVLPTISKEKQHTSSCSSGDIVSGFGLIDKPFDCRSVESGSRQEKAQTANFPTKESSASQHNGTPKSENHISAPRSSEKSMSTGDRDNFIRKGAKRSLDVTEISHHGSYLSDDWDHSGIEDKRHESSKQTPDNVRPHLSTSDAPRSSSSLYNRSDPISNCSPALLPASNRQGLSNPSAKSSVEDDSRVQSNDRRSSIRYKRTGDSHLGRGQYGGWNGGVPNWPPQFANGFMPFQHGPPGIQPVGQPFPSPSVFGVGPFMDFNLSRVPFHIHESPDRFSGHGRPLGWCNPSDGPYPSRSQGWEGRNGILGNDTSTYGIHDSDQAKTLANNGGRILADNKHKGPSTDFRHTRKEIATSVQARGNNPRSNNCEGQAHGEHDSNKGVIESHDATRAKEDAESSRKVPKFANSATNSGDSRDRKFLSKLDISHDLAQPELYRHFISLLGKECQSPCNNVDYKIQGSLEGFKLTDWSSNRVEKPLFPVVADTLFQKALSLYNANRSKLEKDLVLEAPKIGSSPPAQTGASEFVDSETEPSFSSCCETTIKPVKKEPLETTDADFGVPGVAEHQSEPNTSTSVKMEDINYDAAAILHGGGGKVGSSFGNDSSVRCQNLIPGCLSRIPNSPENTH